jgi:hypothetical protein
LETAPFANGVLSRSILYIRVLLSISKGAVLARNHA